MSVAIKQEITEPRVKTEPGMSSSDDVVIIKTISPGQRLDANRTQKGCITIRPDMLNPDPSFQSLGRRSNNPKDKQNHAGKHRNNEKRKKTNGKDASTLANQSDQYRQDSRHTNSHCYPVMKKKKSPKSDKKVSRADVRSPRKTVRPKRMRLRRPPRPPFPGEYSNPGIPRSDDDFPGMTGRDSEENKILGISNHSTKVDLTFEVSAVSKLVIHVETLLKCQDGEDYLKEYLRNLKRREFLEWANLVDKFRWLRRYCY